jgi:transient receptor potential cation channel subfamily A protein 1
MSVQNVESKTRKRKLVRATTDLIELEELNQSPHKHATEGNLAALQDQIENPLVKVTLKSKDRNGMTLLHSAASGNQTEVMTYLIDSGISIDATDNSGNTALHISTANEHIDAVHLLLNRGANDSILNRNEDAPLHIAVRNGSSDVVNAFLEHPTVNIVVQGYRLRTPLHIAAEQDNVEIIDIINNSSLAVEEFKNKASFRLCAYDSDMLTPIHYAARCGSANAMDYMINRCTSHGYPIESILKFLDEENSTPLHVAIDSGHLNVVKVLLKYGSCPVIQNGDQIPPVHLACYQGQIDILQAMIEKCGKDIVHTTTKKGQTPLHWGARSIHGGQVICCLVKQGANVKQVDLEGQTALHSAIIFGSLEAAQELIQSDESVISICDNSQRNVLHFAILRKRQAILNFLLKLPSIRRLVYQQDSTNRTPLHYALLSGSAYYVTALVVSIGSQIVNTKDENGFNYLHLAAANGNWKSLNVLLQTSVASTMLNEQDNKGVTPLHNAAFHGNTLCVEILLSQGAMLHKCYHGYTPFHAAIYKGHLECAKILFHAHPYQKDWEDDKSNTALHLAVLSGSSEVLKLCLDLNVVITRNSSNLTFFDLIIEKADAAAAMVVVNHDRWEECLDYPVLENKPHYFIQLIRSMPTIATAVLDRCHEKSHLSRELPEYYEKFDFKYVRLFEEDKTEIVGDNESIYENEEAVLLTGEDNMMTSVRIKPHKASVMTTQANSTARKNDGMKVLKEMLSYKRVCLLSHSVVVRYLKIKWRGYGRMMYSSMFLVFLLQVLLLSTFVIVTPIPRLNVSDTTFEVISEPSNVTLTEVTIPSTILRFAILGICVINTTFWVIILFTHGLQLLNIARYELFWLCALTLASTYAFLIPWKFAQHGLSFVYWEAGAIAIFCSWFTVALYLKPFDLLGVYITMFLEVLNTLIKAALVCILFIVAFGFAFYIVVGDAFPFKDLGDSFFLTYSYLLGEISYELYVRRSSLGALQHPILTYVFVILSAAVLAVAVMNLLIGLAVGDIDTIKRNALINQRLNMIRTFDKMDVILPSFIIRKYNERFHTIYPNSSVSWIRKAWRFFWRAIKNNENNDDSGPYKLLEVQDAKLNSLQQELKVLYAQQNQQHEELKHLLESVVQSQRLEEEVNHI